MAQTAVGKIAIQVSASTAGLTAGLKGATASVQSFADRARSALFSVQGLLVGSALSLAVREAVNEFRNASVNMARLNAVLLATGGSAGRSALQIRALADEMQRLTRFDDDSIVQAATVLATFRAIKTDVFDDAVRLAADLSETMGMDLQSAIMMVGKALNDPVAGITALRRAGVSFTEAQQELIKSLVATNDLLQAQSIILEELRVEVGGAAKAAGDVDGWAKAANAIGDFKEAAGQALSGLSGPLAQDVQRITEEATQGVRNLDSSYRSLADQVLEAGAAERQQLATQEEMTARLSEIRGLMDALNESTAEYGEQLKTAATPLNGLSQQMAQVQLAANAQAFQVLSVEASNLRIELARLNRDGVVLADWLGKLTEAGTDGASAGVGMFADGIASAHRYMSGLLDDAERLVADGALSSVVWNFQQMAEAARKTAENAADIREKLGGTAVAAASGAVVGASPDGALNDANNILTRRAIPDTGPAALQRGSQEALSAINRFQRQGAEDVQKKQLSKLEEISVGIRELVANGSAVEVAQF